jgi:hypothetical protein
MPGSSAASADWRRQDVADRQGIEHNVFAQGKLNATVASCATKTVADLLKK